MPYASVVLDIPTRALDRAYDYRVPPQLADEAVVGATVLVTFSHRAAVGYVVGLSADAPAGVDTEKVKDIAQVLAPPAFDEVAARVIAWLAREYACPLSEAVRPFLAPGQKVKVSRADEGSPWEIQRDQAGAVDDRWVELADASYEPKSTASDTETESVALCAASASACEDASLTAFRLFSTV